MNERNKIHKRKSVKWIWFHGPYAQRIANGAIKRKRDSSSTTISYSRASIFVFIRYHALHWAQRDYTQSNLLWWREQFRMAMWMDHTILELVYKSIPNTGHNMYDLMCMFIQMRMNQIHEKLSMRSLLQ